jgi:hypothetical protein
LGVDVGGHGAVGIAVDNMQTDHGLVARSVGRFVSWSSMIHQRLLTYNRAEYNVFMNIKELTR